MRLRPAATQGVAGYRCCTVLSECI